MKTRKKGRASGRQPKPSQGARGRSLAAKRLSSRSARPRGVPDEQWLQEMRRVLRIISRQLGELELVLRGIEVLETEQAVRHWFNHVVPALGARPLDLCRTARGRRAVFRELGRIEHGVPP